MLNLSQQIAPSLADRQPSPDQTFGAYVRELLATSKGFGGPFAGAQNQQTQPTPQTKIVDGLFGKFLPESGGNGGDYSPSSNNNSAPFGTAQSVLDLAKASEMLNHPVAKAAGMFTGLPINTIASVVDFMGNQSWNSYNDAFDRSMDAFETAATLPGVGTISDKYGNVQSYTNPSMVEAADRDMFGDDNYDAYDFQGSSDFGSGGGDPTSNDGPSNDHGHQSSGD